jgi:hypothetical protein
MGLKPNLEKLKIQGLNAGESEVETVNIKMIFRDNPRYEFLFTFMIADFIDPTGYGVILGSDCVSLIQQLKLGRGRLNCLGSNI